MKIGSQSQRPSSPEPSLRCGGGAMHLPEPACAAAAWARCDCREEHASMPAAVSCCTTGCPTLALPLLHACCPFACSAPARPQPRVRVPGCGHGPPHLHRVQLVCGGARPAVLCPRLRAHAARHRLHLPRVLQGPKRGAWVAWMAVVGGWGGGRGSPVGLPRVASASRKQQVCRTQLRIRRWSCCSGRQGGGDSREGATKCGLSSHPPLLPTR